MPITVSWHDDSERVLIMRFIGAWDWKMYYEAYDTMRALQFDVPNPVQIIIDMTGMVGYPQDTQAQFTRMAHVVHPHTKAFAVIVNDPGMRAILEKIQRGNSEGAALTHFAADMEEALRLGE